MSDPAASTPLDRWRDRVENAAIPRSARAYASDLHAELCDLAERDTLDVDEVARDLRAEDGTDRRGRAIRILDRLGHLDRALDALRATRSDEPDDDAAP